MNRRFPTVLLVAVTAVVSGCGLLGNGGTAATSSGLGDRTAAQPTDQPTDQPTGGQATDGQATGGQATAAAAEETRELPDPCTLLTESEVRDLTGRDVSEVDPDGATATASVRYCQWQQSGGQLAVFLSHSTEDDFVAATADGTPVDGVGDRAAELAGHLYVLAGPAQFDVYVRGDDDAANLANAKKVVEVLTSRI